MSSRVPISTDGLKILINRELDKHPECRGLRVTALRGLAEDLTDDSNWEVAALGVGVAEIDESTKTALAHAAYPIIARLRAAYDLCPYSNNEPLSPHGSRHRSSAMVERRLYLFFQLDTNRINARQGIPAMNYLENCHRSGLIEIIISDVVQVEASAGGHVGRTRKALSYVFAKGAVETEGELDFKRRVEQVLFPDGLRGQADANDVEIVTRAKKYHSILVTADGNSRTQPGGILGNRRELAVMGVQVMTAEEAVDLVRQKISSRDESARYEASRLGSDLPSWVGQD